MDFNSSFMDFVSSLEEVEIVEKPSFKTPFNLIYSKESSFYFHLISIENLNKINDPLFFQNISLTHLRQKLKIIHVWEDLWNTRQEQMKSRVASLSFKNKTIHGRQCKVKRIDKHIYDEFFSNEHLLGSANARYKYGLYFKEELAACAGISAGRLMSREGDLRKSYEIIRFASKKNQTVTGGFSKLLKHIENELLVQEWMTYADLDWAMEGVYHRLEFTVKSITAPQKIWIHRETYHRKFDHHTDESFDYKLFIPTYNSGNIKMIKRNG